MQMAEISQLVYPEAIQQALSQCEYDTFKALCEDAHPADVADILNAIDDNSAIDTALSHLDNAKCAEIYSYLSEDKQRDLAQMSSDARLWQVLSEMDPDDRVDVLKVLPEERRIRLILAFGKQERDNIRRLFAYPEGTAGSVMTSDYITLTADMTADAAINKIRQQALDKETIYYCYIVDQHHKLIGFVSLKDLILADPQQVVANVMEENVIAAKATDDQENAARKIGKYNLIALPITNEQGIMLGIITHDDAIDVINQEQTEDMEKFMAISGAHTGGYLSMPTWSHFRNRAPWIVGLAILGFLSGYILHTYEDALAAVIILMLYIPMVTDTGGNTGSQSATLVVRSLALGEISVKDTFKVIFKEFKISAMIAVLLALVAFVKVYFFASIFSASEQSTGGHELVTIASVIAFALALQVVTATIIGALLPLTAQKFKLDPAVVASPALTTIVDITGLLIFFFVATHLLGIS
jgi:magnesium transporter